MFIIFLVTDRYSGESSEQIVGYKETEDDARRYCELKTDEIKNTYNENMGNKFYAFRKIELIED